MKQLKTGGRKVGTPNKATGAIRENFEALVQGNLATLKSDLKALKPIDRVRAIIDLAKFVVPTLKSIDLVAEVTTAPPPDLSLLSTEELLTRAAAIRAANAPKLLEN